MKIKVAIIILGSLLVLIFRWFSTGLLLAGAINRYLYGYELETSQFTNFIGYLLIGVLLMSLVSGLIIGYIAGSIRKAK